MERLVRLVRSRSSRGPTISQTRPTPSYAGPTATSCGGLLVSLRAAQVASGVNSADLPHRVKGEPAQNASETRWNCMGLSARVVRPQENVTAVLAICKMLPGRALDIRPMLVFIGERLSCSYNRSTAHLESSTPVCAAHMPVMCMISRAFCARV